MIDEKDPSAPADAEPPAPPALPSIHEAECESGPSGAVLRGVELDLATAVA